MLPDVHQPGGVPPLPPLPPAPVVPAEPVVPPRPALPVVPAVPIVPALPLVPPRPPAPVVPAVPLVPAEPVEATQVPFVHWPFVQGWLQPPQWVLLVFVFTHELPHSMSVPVQPQEPLLHAVAPAGQALQPPQCAIVLSPEAGMHAPPEHIVCPDGQLARHALLLQTCPVGQALQPPQCCASDDTQLPLQRKRPVAQVQVPF